MTDRDRLIELFVEVDDMCDRTHDCVHCEYEQKSECVNEMKADHLLANGVIVQKQGEWKTTQEPLGWKDVECVECSACYESWMLNEDFDFEFCKEVWHYCPNCGAKIKECDNNE